MDIIENLVLLLCWGEEFDYEKWENLNSKVSFHNLAYRVNENVNNDKENYINHILNTYK